MRSDEKRNMDRSFKGNFSLYALTPFFAISYYFVGLVGFASYLPIVNIFFRRLRISQILETIFNLNKENSKLKDNSIFKNSLNSKKK